MLPGELIIVGELVRRSGLRKWHNQDLHSIRVVDMDDGAMGSLCFASNAEGRKYGRTVSEGWFKDSDGVPVLVSLNVDRDGDLFELDSWKVDFSARNRLPSDPSELFYGPAVME